MCGITGIIGRNSANNRSTTERAIKVLNHRGPDSSGIWVSEDNRVAFGHARLSIQDISSMAAQPMMSHNKDYILIYNGEIYNKNKIHTSISNKSKKLLRSTSDTEILLYSLIDNGVIETCRIIDGMFAFCFYDRINDKIFLARDKFGEKPLFYSSYNNVITFSSEIKAFKHYPNYNNELDQDSIDYYLRYGFIPSSESIYLHIKQISPGEIIEIDTSNNTIKNRTKYYNLRIQREESSTDNIDINYLSDLIEESVKSRLIGDVPIGCFLSGGIDSSMIAAFAARNHNKKLKTFSIGFKDKNFDESLSAKNIARFLGTEHTEYIIGESELIDYIPEITNTWDQPFADSSQIPMLALCRMTSKEVKVCLSGDGADEMFGGYERYRRTMIFAGIPIKTRLILTRLLDILSTYIDRLSINKSIQDKLIKINYLLKKKNEIELYEEICSLGIGLDIGKNSFTNGIEKIKAMYQESNDILIYCMQSDLDHYLTEDILVKADRASMRYSLEVRSPFLNPSIVDSAFGYNSNYLSDCFVGKKPLREIASKIFHKSLIQRKKKGFAVPLNSWLRKPLEKWSYERIYDSFLTNKGIINKDLVHRIYQENLNGSRNWSHQLWALIMFEEWYRNSNQN